MTSRFAHRLLLLLLRGEAALAGLLLLLGRCGLLSLLLLLGGALALALSRSRGVVAAGVETRCQQASQQQQSLGDQSKVLAARGPAHTEM